MLNDSIVGFYVFFYVNNSYFIYMKTRPYILKELTWKEVKESDYDLAILPWGACEAHNYHLPYGTDIYEADYMVEESARKAYDQGAKVIVLPTLPFGVNTGQTDITLDINLHPSTQHKILDDIIEVLNRQGIKKLLVFNSHGGNTFKTMLRELGVKYPEMFLSSCHWFRSVDKDKYFEEKGDHADEMETSIMMYIQPDLVKPLDVAGDGAAKKWRIKGINEGWAWAERRWSQVTADTGIGNPYKSTAEKGQKFVEDVSSKLAELFVDISKTSIDDLYK